MCFTDLLHYLLVMFNSKPNLKTAPPFWFIGKRVYMQLCIVAFLDGAGTGMARPNNVHGGSYPVTARIVIPPGTQAYSNCPTRSNVFIVVFCAGFSMQVVPQESHVGSKASQGSNKWQFHPAARLGGVSFQISPPARIPWNRMFSKHFCRCAR